MELKPGYGPLTQSSQETVGLSYSASNPHGLKQYEIFKPFEEQ